MENDESVFIKSDNNESVHQFNKELDINNKGIVGLYNLGNTCYMNSVIQLLRSSPYLCNFLFSHTNESEYSDIDDRKRRNILYATKELIEQLNSNSRPSCIKPLKYLCIIRGATKNTFYSMFSLPIPNDAHEFLLFLLDNIHEASINKYEYIQEICDSDNENNVNENMNIRANNAINYFLSKNNSKLFNIFFGVIRKTICCKKCNNKEYSWDMINTLKVTFSENNFINYIESEYKPEIIETYNCEKCLSKTSAEIISDIWSLPPSLIVVLKRFNYDGRKCMNISPYKGEQLSFEHLFAKESRHESKQWKYNIHSVIDHHGSHLGGHYSSQYYDVNSKKWYIFDDERIQNIESPQLNNRSNYIYLFNKE